MHRNILKKTSSEPLLGSVCANCGAGGNDHHTSACKNKPKCVNCGKEHVPRSNQCEIWKKETEIMKIKTTKNITYLEAKKLFDSQSTDLDISKIVHSLSSKLETKTTGTQFFEEDFVIHTNTRVVTPSVKISGPKTPSVSDSNVQSNTNTRPRANSAARLHSQSSSQSSSQFRPQSSSQSGSHSKPQNENNRSSSGQNSSRRANSRGSSSDKQGKGSNDPIKMANKYGVLHDDMVTI